MTPIVIDLEWNQPLAGRTRNPLLYGEIMQIGAAKIDIDCNVLDTFSVNIRTVIYKKLNRDIALLTGLKDSDLENGISFQEAISRFRDWCGKDFFFVSWSPSDYDMMYNNLQFFHMDLDWLPKTYDAQLMFDDMEMQENRQWPLNYALFHYSEKPDGAHNALADVLSTILIMKHLDLEDGFSDDYFRCDSYTDDDLEEELGGNYKE